VGQQQEEVVSQSPEHLAIHVAVAGTVFADDSGDLDSKEAVFGVD
jgi:hypothetical protein